MACLTLSSLSLESLHVDGDLSEARFGDSSGIHFPIWLLVLFNKHAHQMSVRRHLSPLFRLDYLPLAGLLIASLKAYVYFQESIH